MVPAAVLLVHDCEHEDAGAITLTRRDKKETAFLCGCTMVCAMLIYIARVVHV